MTVFHVAKINNWLFEMRKNTQHATTATTATLTSNIWIMYVVRLSINCSIEIETNSWSVDRSIALVKARLAHTTFLSICRDCRTVAIQLRKSLCIDFQHFFVVAWKQYNQQVNIFGIWNYGREWTIATIIGSYFHHSTQCSKRLSLRNAKSTKNVDNKPVTLAE